MMLFCYQSLKWVFNKNLIVLANSVRTGASQSMCQKQTLILINKAGCHISREFLLDTEPIECVTPLITKTFISEHLEVSLWPTKKNIKKHKALKAYYKLQKDFLCLNLGVKNI